MQLAELVTADHSQVMSILLPHPAQHFPQPQPLFANTAYPGMWLARKSRMTCDVHT